MDSEVNCICKVLEEISEFQSLYEFDRFQKYIGDSEKRGDLKEVAVQQYYAGFNEQWFICTGCKNIWRLVHPDFPFEGLWEIVK